MRPLPQFLLRALLALAPAALPAASPKPLRILLVTGGCCHDYAQQKELLKTGLERRANVVVEHLHTPDKTIKPPLSSHQNPGYADGYDLVIHDECAAGINDPAAVRHVLAPHLRGLPAVALHCAMHSYRVAADVSQPQAPGSAGALWFDFLGLQSSRHGPQEPIEVTFTGGDHPITRGLQGWTTGKEELYNNVQPPSVWPAHRALASGFQRTRNKKTGQAEDLRAVVAWTHEYGPAKARVFCTTLGHNNETVADARYLDLLARGVLWAAGQLDAQGRPAPGYGPAAR